MLTTTSYLSEAYNALERNKKNSTDIILHERYKDYNGVFDRDILEDGMTNSTFRQRPGEKIIIKLSDIVWFENLSIGNFTLTDQRIFYQPIFYDVPMTEKNLEIELDHISKVGHWSVKSASGIVVFAGDNNTKVEFMSKIPFKMLKVWKALKHINKGYQLLDPTAITRMQQQKTITGWGIVGSIAAGAGAIGGGLLLVNKFLNKK
jgi:hypothetical protein